MSDDFCHYCNGIELHYRCPACGKLPNDLTFANVQEARDALKAMETWNKNGTIPYEAYVCFKGIVNATNQMAKDIKEIKEKLANGH